MMMSDLLIFREPDMTYRLRIRLGGEIPVVKCLSLEQPTIDGKYEVLVGINADKKPVYMRIENIGAIDSTFVKACKNAVESTPEKPPPLNLDAATEKHISDFCEAKAKEIIELWVSSNGDAGKASK